MASTQIKSILNLYCIKFPNNAIIFRSQPNIRQIENSGQNNSRKTSVKEKGATKSSMRMHISQSAPHTPVSAPSHESDAAHFKSVPRLLSEPSVNINSQSPSQRSMDSNFRKSPFLNDKKSIGSELSTQDGDSHHRNSNQDTLNIKHAQNIAPVHSPLLAPNKDFLPKSPLVKRDMKIQLENTKTMHAKMSPNTTDIDVTHV